MEQHVFSVTEVNQYIKSIIDGVPQLGDLLIRGELSNYKVYPSGHHYFTLKDGESAIRCVMFKGSAMRLRFRPRPRLHCRYRAAGCAPRRIGLRCECLHLRWCFPDCRPWRSILSSASAGAPFARPTFHTHSSPFPCPGSPTVT